MAGGLFKFFKPRAEKHRPPIDLAETLGRARALYEQSQHADALAICQELLERHPDHVDTLFLMGEVASMQGEPDRAQQLFRRVLALKPDHAPAHYKCGNLLKDRQQMEAALASYDEAIALDPRYAYALCNRGFVLQSLNRWDAALESYDQAILLIPGDALAHYNRARVLRELQRPEQALASYTRAIAVKPDYLEAYCNRGILLIEMRRWDEALADFDRAISLKPDYPQVYLDRANLLINMRQYVAAIASFDRAIALKAESRFVLGLRRYAQMNVCDWNDLPGDVHRLAVGIGAGEMMSPPLPLLALVDSAPLHYEAAKIWLQEEHPPGLELAPISPRARPRKARIGYFSGDFYDHPVAMLMAEVIETHDRSNYEVYAFSFGAHSQDEMRKRLEKGFDQFINVLGKSDRDIALLARQLDIDIAVDLTGHTGISRTGIFALRAAPLQVNYLGYPGTIGADYMDYLIADATVLPEAQERYYAEKIVRLPNCFLPHDSSRAIASTVYSRDELGLPATGFVFCCFNNSFKITPEVFDGWMRILARVPHSVLWLSHNNEVATDNLRRECLRRGVAGERLIFAKRMPSPADHLARHRAAGLFLDTRPYNAHATAINALWAGLPVLTFPGEGFASRVAASLLTAIGLPELIATSAADYEDTAVRMAEDPQFHAAVKEKLAHNRLHQPLFDTPRFTRNLETGYARILERFHAGLPPDHIHVAP